MDFDWHTSLKNRVIIRIAMLTRQAGLNWLFCANQLACFYALEDVTANFCAIKKAQALAGSTVNL